MPKDLPQRIYQLRDAKMSQREIAVKLHISPMTVKYHLRKRSDYETLQFANSLAKLVADAPNVFCKSELQITIDRLRKNNQKRFEMLYPLFLRFADDGCKYCFEFQDESCLPEWKTRLILKEMVAEGLLIFLQKNNRELGEYLRKV